MRSLKDFKERIINPGNIVITTHPNPDADALGSSLGMARYLSNYGHHVNVVSPTAYPDFLSWMPGSEHILVFQENEVLGKKMFAAADMIFCLDFSRLERINSIGEIIAASNADKVLIDHHLYPEEFADYTFWSCEAAATAELVYDLIERLGDLEKIDKEIADLLYAGIMTDTGSFRHSSTSAKIHNIVASLINLGVDVNRVSSLIYDNNTSSRLRLLGLALSTRLKIEPDFQTAYIVLSREDLQSHQYKKGDTEGFVNYALSINGITMGAIIVEKEKEIKLSFRSRGNFSVNEFAKENFSGGGHKNAAGGYFNGSLKEAEAKFVSLLPKYKSKLTKEKYS